MFCLGHQFLAHVLGCRVGPLPQKSVGFITGELTPVGRAHPVLQGLPAQLKLFKWHGQGVLPPLPPGIELLAQLAAAPVEAIGVASNPRVVGVQFDNHAGPVTWSRGSSGRGLGPDRLRGRPCGYARHGRSPGRRHGPGVPPVHGQLSAVWPGVPKLSWDS